MPGNLSVTMETTQEDGPVTPVTPRALRRGGGGASDSGHESFSSRESIKSITKSIVQQRAQMFETGSGDGESGTGGSDGKSGDTGGSENGDGPVKELTEETPVKDKSPWQSPERVIPASPKKAVSSAVAATRQAGEGLTSPQTSPTHTRSRRTHSPRRGSPVRSPKANCQPKIILGAAPKPVETPVKPPRSKKPSVKLRHQDPNGSPGSPAVKPRVSRSESMNEKPVPVRKAPEVPGPRPQRLSAEETPTPVPRTPTPTPTDQDPLVEVLPKRLSPAEKPQVPEKPQPPEKPEESLQSKPSKPTPPAKPSDLNRAKPPKPVRPSKPEVPSEKPPKPAETPEWMKKRQELIRTRSKSDPISDPAPGPVAETDPSEGKDPELDMPKYAVVDKAKKKRQRPKSGEDPVKRSSGYDNVVLLESAGDIAMEKPDAPPKPPRTFAHDQYLKRRAEKREKRRSTSLGQGQYEQIVNGLRNPKQITASCDSPAGTRTSTASSDSGVKPYASSVSPGEVSERGGEALYEEILAGRGERKPQPPPRPKAPQRPPAPGVLRVRKDQSSVVNVVKHNAKIPKDGFIKSGQRKISNPSYERHHDIIPIKTYRDQTTGALKRHKSDEYLYADPQTTRPEMTRPPSGAGTETTPGKGVMSDQDPVYQDPADLTTPRARSCVTAHGVSLDEEGYAIPDMQRHTLGRRQKFRSPSFNIKGVPKWGTLDRTRLAKFANHDFRASIARKKLPSVREKVSRAYSILRRRPVLTPEGQPALEVSPEEDEDSQVDIEEHQKRLAHVSSIKEKQYATLEYTREQAGRSQPHLFDYALVVGLEKNPETNKYRPHIMYKFPDQLPPGIETIAEFCFPDAEQWRPVTQAPTEDFFFVLTSADGSRHYGYCRRLLPPGAQNRLPEVYCCVSALGAAGFYQQLLSELDKLRQLSPDLPYHLIKAAYAHPLPAPGRETWISCPVNDGKKETVILKRSGDSRLEKVTFEPLFKHLNVDTILKVFGAVLLERRILFTAQHLSTLSSCISALTLILFPFSWQHTFVPVLPVSMIDVCCAPTPYILGILSTALPHLQKLELEEVLIVDLDTNSLVASMGDEQAILPRKLQKCLRSALNEESDVSGVARDTVIFEAFLRLFVETTGHYTEFMNTQQDGELVFQKEQFTKAVSSKSIRLFLEWFVETQMFEVFITERLTEGEPNPGLFETRIEEYRDEMEQMSLSFKDNVKQIGRRVISLVSEAGGKLKKAFGGERNVYV